jgi:hypothetical protein
MEGLSKPRIYRSWSPRTGQFFWTLNDVPHRWGMTNPKERNLWREAQIYVAKLNQSTRK